MNNIANLEIRILVEFVQFAVKFLNGFELAILILTLFFIIIWIFLSADNPDI
jgi:hypothetical protein